MLANATQSKNKIKTIQNYAANQICGMLGCVHQTFGCSAQEFAGQFYMLEERLELLENTLENPAATGVEGQIVGNMELCIPMHDQDPILIMVKHVCTINACIHNMRCWSTFQPAYLQAASALPCQRLSLTSIAANCYQGACRWDSKALRPLG